MTDNKFYKELFQLLHTFNKELDVSVSTVSYSRAAHLILTKVDNSDIDRNLSTFIYESVTYSACNSWDLLCAAALLSFREITIEVAQIMLSAENYYLSRGKHLELTEDIIRDLLNTDSGNYAFHVTVESIKSYIKDVGTPKDFKLDWDPSLDREFSRKGLHTN